MVDRQEAYRQLVTARKACRSCAGLVNASAIQHGEFDAEDIGAWTRWLGDLTARVMVVGQDWGDQRAFIRQAGVDVQHNPTNQMLRELLASVGITVPDVGMATGPAGVFATNAILCLKDAGSQSAVRTQWFAECGPRFLRPQVELIRPEVVVCLGERAYAATLSAFGLPVHRNWRDAVDGHGIALPCGSVAVAVYHCGRRILNTHRKRATQFNDWERVARLLQRGSPPEAPDTPVRS